MRGSNLRPDAGRRRRLRRTEKRLSSPVSLLMRPMNQPVVGEEVDCIGALRALPSPPPPAPPGPQTQPAVAKRNLEEYGKCSIRFCPPLAHGARRNLSFYTRTLIFPGKDELTPCDRRLASSRSHGDPTFLLVNKAVDKIDVLERTHRTRAVLTSENSSCSHTRAVAGLRRRRSAWKRVGL